MASTTFSFLILFLSLWVSLMSPASSFASTSETLLDITKAFAKNVDLPTLNATLHYTYNAPNSSLSIVFAAAPASPNGWIAWAINPTGKGMVGSQALIALKSNGSLLAKLFNIISYSSIVETNKLAFDVWDLAAESDASGKSIIYASVKVPAGVTKLNIVWQVGANVINGGPTKHALAKENLNSKLELQL